MNNVVDKVKQVIVMRTKYPDGKGGLRTIRKGKLIAQGAHASVAFLGNKIRAFYNSLDDIPSYERWAYKASRPTISLSKEENLWFKESFAKIVLYVETEEELLALRNKCLEAGLTTHLIQDAGDTEFEGVPTYTALAIGPHVSSKIDGITGSLPLL